MKLDINKVHSVIRSNESLTDIYRWYLTHNASLSLPYHNINSTLGILYHIICIYENSRKPDCSYGFSLDESDLFILMVSGLFCFYNNSNGIFPDEIDAENAQDGLEACMAKFFEDSESTRNIIDTCKNNIYAALCNNSQADVQMTIQQTILSECMNLDIFYDNFLTAGLIGMYSESGNGQDFVIFVSGKLKSIIENIEKFRLQYSLNLWSTYGNELMENINNFSKIILLKQ